MTKNTVRTEAQKRASEKWENKFKQRIVRIPFDKDKKIIDKCKKNKESFNGFVNRIIDEEIKSK